MPTGYTADLCEKDVPFEEFVLTCARAFGACITMRDEPMDKPIPESFETEDSYYVKALKEAREEKDAVVAKSDEEILKDEEKRLRDDIALNESYIEKTKQTRERLIVMIGKVSVWEPPTSEHYELKKFMLQQLESTLEHDGSYNYYEKELAKQKEDLNPFLNGNMLARHLRVKRLNTLIERIHSYEESLQKEAKTAKSRTKWVQQLRASLKE